MEAFVNMLILDTSCKTIYNDTEVICCDGVIFLNRILLALVFQELIDPVKNVSELEVKNMQELSQITLMIPDIRRKEIENKLKLFFRSIRSENLTENAANLNKNNIIIGTGNVEAEVPDLNKNLVKKKIDFSCTDDKSREIKSDDFLHESQEQIKPVIQEFSNNQVNCDFRDCKKAFKSKTGLRWHINSTHFFTKTRFYVCEICADIFDDESEFQNHKSRYLLKPNVYKCPQESCESHFKSIKMLTSHYRKHDDIYMYLCQDCKSTFFVNCFEPHPCMSHSIRIMCQMCSNLFSTKSLYWHHVTGTHAHGSRERKERYKCDQCGKGFPNKHNYERHVLMHEDAQNYTCNACGKKFKCMIDLTKHTKMHSGVKPIKCEYCHKKFLNTNLLRRHRVIHSGVNEFDTLNLSERVYSALENAKEIIRNIV